jgi:hypothetical protein
MDERTCWRRVKTGFSYVTKYTDGAFLGSMREVTDIQATRKLLKDQFHFLPEIQTDATGGW